MPAYNSENFISKSIDSVINQSFLNYEMIIVDDGSNDSTKEIIKMYCKKNSKIRLLSKSNSGITESLNYGLKFCLGKWIARLDADDLCQFDRLKKQILLAESSTKLGLVGSDALFINKFDKNLFHYSYPSNHEELKNNLLGGKKFFPHSSAFYNSELVSALGGYRYRAGMSEDWDLWLRIASKKEITNINEPLIKIRIHNDQVSKKNPINHAYDTRTVIIANFINKREKYDPLEIFSEDEFKTFKFYIINNFKKLGFNEFIKLTTILRKPFLNKLIIPFIFLKYIMRPIYVYSFIRFKFSPQSIHINIAENFHKKYLNKKNR